MESTFSTFSTKWWPFWKTAVISSVQLIVRVIHPGIVQEGPPNTLIPNNLLQLPMSGWLTWVPVWQSLPRYMLNVHTCIHTRTTYTCMHYNTQNTVLADISVLALECYNFFVRWAINLIFLHRIIHNYEQFLRKFQFCSIKELRNMGKFVFLRISYFGEKFKKLTFSPKITMKIITKPNKCYTILWQI